MNDKERILMTIIDRLYSTQVLALNGIRESMFVDEIMGHDYVHFGAYDDRKVKPGDLVLAQTGRVDDFKIGWVESTVTHDTCIIREIGSDRLCRYSNESFIRIVGLHDELLLEGDQYQFKLKVLKAFSRGEHSYIYRYGGIEFPEPRKARFWIRCIFGGVPPGSKKPFPVEMKWNKRTTIKSILQNMIDAGYGTAFKNNKDNES